MSNLQSLMDALWEDYARINPQAEKIHTLLKDQGEQNLTNDHIAFRTLEGDTLGIDRLAQIFVREGYEKKDHYDFKLKKLSAYHYEHANPLLPKIFISELKTREFSTFLQDTLAKCAEKVRALRPSDRELILLRTPWERSYSVYERLLGESEYAAWFYSFGVRANHFTVSLNSLEKFNDINELNGFLKVNHFPLNTSGGEIKGTPECFLEQSSTLAHPVEVEFQEGKKSIPGCYYEFAKRYPDASGSLFQGFVSQSADRIFESTDRNR